MQPQRHLSFEFEIKKKPNGILIEGHSNAATVDRMKERIDPKGWRLDNYKKNPVVLFDHGKDPAFGTLPVGKAHEVGPTDTGLFTKIMLSNSKTEKISAVRDLVEEGILKTFSVGFNPIDMEKDGQNPDIHVIKSAELIEQSIVPIPMNQDSTFATVSKRFLGDNKTAKQWFDKHVVRMALVHKGSWVAAALHQAIYDQLETNQMTDREAALKYVADTAGVKIGAVYDVLSGETTPVPPPIIEAFAKMLRLDKDFLLNLDKGDMALMERVLSRQQQQEGKGMASKKTKAAGDPTATAPAAGAGDGGTPGAADPEETTEPGGEEPKMVVYAVAIPKSMADTADAASSIAEQHGFKIDQIDETDTQWVISQRATDDLDMEEATMVDLGDGAIALAAPPKAAPKSAEAEGAKAKTPPPTPPPASGDKPGATATDPNAKPDDADEATDQGSGLAKDALDKMLADYKAEVKTVEADAADSTAPAWVSDGDLWEKAESASEEALGKVDYAFTVYAFLNMGGGKKAGHPGMTKGVDGQPIDDNPYLTLARQTNVLLATLLNETQGMSKKLDGLADLSVKLATEDSTEGGDGTDGQGDLAKGLDELATYRRNLETSLKRLGV